MRLIDADELDKIKYHPIPYTHIVPSDVDAESYKRGWNDAIDSVICCTPTIEERKTGRWLPDNNNYYGERYICSACGKSYKVDTCMGKPLWQFCPCGARMEDATNG